jgi:hypothetical protein
MAGKDGFSSEVSTGGCGEGGVLAKELEDILRVMDKAGHWAAYLGIYGVWELKVELMISRGHHERQDNIKT